MTLTIDTQPVPLRLDENGVIRVHNTRLTLDIVVNAYLAGDTAEEIAAQYPVLELADVYGVITYYLNNQAEVDAYLADRQSEADRLRYEIEERFPQKALRERLQARKDQE